ncbi:phytoene desaturase family protein [Demequina flava]|uniref:phytoene desaturase family protein n=1 Tax=Demequina flava TaxID=1095025 RepID=UPI0009E55F54|nr:phytoene desaturase family protein [Demequina flava]
MNGRVVVIGGGVSGLATAALLARGGADVTLVEQQEQVGGRAGRLEIDGFTFDTGPSWYLMRDAFEHFFDLLGRDVNDELDLIDLDPRYRVFFEGQGEPASALDVSADAARNWAAFNDLSPGDGDAMRAYADAAGERYRLALDRFLYTTFEKPTRSLDAATARRLPELAGLLTRPLGDAIADKVADPRLRQILAFHAVFLGSTPDRLPSLFSLMSHLDLIEGVSYPRGGMYAVIEALARVAQEEGVRIRTGASVEQIIVHRGRATGVRLQDGSVLRADAVVSGADMHHTETALLERQFQSRPERTWSSKRPGISALLVMAGVEGELPELEHHTLLFTRDWEKNFSDIMDRGAVPQPASIYVSRTSATDDTAPPGHENLVMLVPFPADPALGADAGSRADLDQHIGRYLDQVGQWAQIPELRRRTSVKKVLTPHYFASELNAWQGGALGLEHSLRQSAMFRPANVSGAVPNLLYAGSSTVPGIGVPICLISAELVAKRLLGATDASPLQAPLPQGYLARSRRGGTLGQIARALGGNAAGSHSSPESRPEAGR